MGITGQKINIILFAANGKYFDFPIVDQQSKYEVIKVKEVKELIRYILSNDLTLVFILDKVLSPENKNLISEFSDKIVNCKFVHISEERYAIDAWKMDLFHFLSNPFSEGEILKVYAKFKKAVGMDEAFFIYSDQEGMHSIPFTSIFFFRASGNYTEIRIAGNKKILLSKQLGVVEQQIIAKNEFVRVNRSWILNFKNIKTLTSQTLTFKNDSVEIELSKEMYQIIKKIIANR